MPSTGLWASSAIGSADSTSEVVELPWIGNELPGDRIARIGRIDVVHDVGRDRERIALRDPFKVAAAPGRNESGGNQVIDEAQRLACGRHDDTSCLARLSIRPVIVRGRPNVNRRTRALRRPAGALLRGPVMPPESPVRIARAAISVLLSGPTTSQEQGPSNEKLSRWRGSHPRSISQAQGRLHHVLAGLGMVTGLGGAGAPEARQEARARPSWNPGTRPSPSTWPAATP